MDFRSSSSKVQTKKIDNIPSMIYQRIHYTGMAPAMAQPHNNQGSVDEDFLDDVLEELIEQPDTSFNRLSSFLLRLKLVCDSQLFSLWVNLPSPAEVSPSHAATATVTATTSPT